MNGKLLSAGAALLLALSGCAVKNPLSPAKPLVITDKSAYTIVLPDKTDGRSVDTGLTEASRMLVRAFRAASGTEMKIVREKNFKGGKAIYLGNTAALRKTGFDPEKECANYEYLIREKDGDLYIAGRDFMHLWLVKRTERNMSHATMGTVKGAVAFAEEFLDVRFLLRGEVGTEYARKKGKVQIPADLNRFVKPMLDFGCGRYPGASLYDYSCNNVGAGGLRTYGGHSYYNAVPAVKYLKDHPEYFALINGRRTGSGNHLCISNKQVQELIYQEALRELDKGANIVQMAQTDGYVPCQCEKCKAFGDTDDPGEKLWILHIQHARRLLKERPGKRLHLLAYGPTVNPPRQFKEFPENVMVELCSYSPDRFAEWRNKVKVPGGFSCYIYNWGTYNETGFTPKRTPEYAAEQIRLFAANNVKGIYRCGCFENMGMEGPTYYVYGKMIDDPSQDYKTLENEFYLRAYKEVAAPMKVFFTEFYKRLEMYSTLQKGGFHDYKADSLPKDPKVLLSAIYTPELLEKLESSLTVSEKLAKDPKVKLRLKAVRFDFEYAKNLAQCIHFYYAYRLKPSRASFEPLAEALKARQKLIKGCLNAKRRRYIPGWPEAEVFGGSSLNRSMLLTNGRLRGLISAPLNWDVDRLLKEKILPGTDVKSMDVLPVSDRVPFDFSAPVWKQGKWYSFEFVDPKEDLFKSKAKLLYDDKNIYCGIETVITNTQFTKFGRDGGLWNQDCAELFLDPTGTRGTYYHIIIAPVADCMYDEAMGLITDPLHPLYGKPDRHWNGKWSYQTKIVKGKWYSLITVPFSTLNTARPVPGTVWLGNVAREGYAEDPAKPLPGHKSHQPQLSIWSPNMETTGFTNPASFGKMVFR